MAKEEFKGGFTDIETFGTYFKKGSKYKYVSCRKVKDIFIWRAQFYHKGKNLNSKLYKTEREAAIAVDLFMINTGRPPINILKAKN